MPVVADLERLVGDGVLTPAQADELRRRARGTMIRLAINTLLTGGIIVAAAGLVVLLANALAVAVVGAALVAAGMTVLARAAPVWRMFGLAAFLIGAGMLIGGAAIEAVDKMPPAAAALLGVIAGGALAVAGTALLRAGREGFGFVAGMAMLAGLGLHLAGAYALAYLTDLQGMAVAGLSIYAAMLIAAAGWFSDVRLVTALAIAPFAQVLDTGTAYFHAVYVFYSPEPALSILQMGLAVGLCTLVMRDLGPRDARHLGVFAILAFVVGNLCFLVGSLWGDRVGDSWARAALERRYPDDWEAVWNGMEAFRQGALHIPAGVFALIWAGALAAAAVWAAQTGRRGLFNASMTFGAIHAYTQFFSNWGDSALSWVLGGLAAIPMAWGIWRLNQRFA